MIRWLEPENGPKDKALSQDKSILNKIDVILSSKKNMRKLKEIAGSRTAGIWRIKRAKIIFGAREGKSVEELVLAVRVTPNSIIKCLKKFAENGLKYFDQPERRPTQREIAVENMLFFLENPPQKKSGRWNEVSVKYIGHIFSAKKIQKIREEILNNHKYCTNIAHKICSIFDIRQSNGKYKVSQMSAILKRMDMDNIISLPSFKKKEHNSPNQSLVKKKVYKKPPRQIILKQSDIEQLQIIPALSKKDLTLWKDLIEQHHYINTTRLFGAQMRYLVYGGTGLSEPTDIYKIGSERLTEKYLKKQYADMTRGQNLLAALGFAAGSWRLSSRDKFIGWSDEQRTANLKFVVNNSRFLILPWIKSPNLASRILGRISRQIKFDWEARYNYRPVLLETFVQQDRFKGTCYRAANWIHIGASEGYSLHNKYKKRAVTKDIFIYPLCKNFQKKLCRENGVIH